MRQITLYTKPGCHLCDEALDLLLMLGDELDEKLDIEEINILENPELYARYRHTIPVITIDPQADGPGLCAPITASALRQALGLDVSREAGPDRLQVADAGV
jgi:glutaredoxin